jgi:hypothetical protein
MREHGVDFPDPVNGRFEFKGKPRDQRNMEKAQKACGHILQGVAPPMSEEQQSELREAALDFAKCMREHGIDFPDPTFRDGGVLQRAPKGSVDDPKFKEAQKACEPILRAVQPDGQSTQEQGT